MKTYIRGNLELNADIKYFSFQILHAQKAYISMWNSSYIDYYVSGNTKQLI